MYIRLFLIACKGNQYFYTGKGNGQCFISWLFKFNIVTDLQIDCGYKKIWHYEIVILYLSG